VEKDTKSAAEFYNDKVKLLASNISDLEAIVQQKTNNLRMVEEGKETLTHIVLVEQELTLDVAQSYGRRCWQVRRDRHKRLEVSIAARIKELRDMSSPVGYLLRRTNLTCLAP
jgi:hypothetical protein